MSGKSVQENTKVNNSFSTRFLTIVGFLTAMILFWLGYAGYRSYDIVKTTYRLSGKANALQGSILYLDEVLTMSSRMYVATGDVKWEQRYRSFEPQLESAINEVIKISPQANIVKAARLTDSANTALVKMENESFELVRQGRNEDAKSILFGKEYEKQKRIYAESIKQFTALFMSSINKMIDTENQLIIFNLLTIVVALGILIFGWGIVFRVFRKAERLLLEDKLVQKDNLIERKATESEQYFRALIENSLDIIAIINSDGRIDYISPSSHRVLGYKSEELIGRNAFEWIHPEDIPKVVATIGEGLKEHSAIRRQEFRFRHKNGTWLDMDSQGQNRLHDPLIKGIVVNSRDISERKMFLEVFDQIRKQQDALLNNIPDIAWLKDKESCMVAVNEAYAVACGKKREDIIGKNDLDLWPEDLAKKYLQDDQEVMANKKRTNFVEQLEDNSGQRIWIETIKTPVIDEKGQVIGTVGIARDVTNRKELEDKLRKLSQALEQSQSSIVITDLNGAIEFVNRKFCEVTGYSFKEVIGKNPRILKSGETLPEEYRNLWETISAGGVWRGEFHNKKKNGELYWESAVISSVKNKFGGITHYLAIKEDLTDRKKMENQLRIAKTELVGNEKMLHEMLVNLQEAHDQLKHSQSKLLQSEKMAAIGQLSAGIAHEINNPIGFINSNLETLEHYVESYMQLLRATENIKSAIHAKEFERASTLVIELEKVEEKVNLSFMTGDIENLIRESRSGIERIKKIISDLRIFARKDQEGMELSDVEKILEGIINIVWNEIKYKAELKKEYAKVPQVYCNAQKLGQVFINLLINAVHAIGDKGVITVKIYQEDEWVCIEVQDTGCGIPPENLSKIFEPFFTTKPVGKGTGLGLSVSYDILRQHGGRIDVLSEVHQGTRFIVKLPKSLKS